MEQPEVDELNIVAQKYYRSIKDQNKNGICQFEHFCNDLNLDIDGKCNKITAVKQFLCKYHKLKYCRHCPECYNFINGKSKCCIKCRCVISNCPNPGKLKDNQSDNLKRYCKDHIALACNICDNLNCDEHVCSIHNCKNPVLPNIPNVCDTHLCVYCKQLFKEGVKEKEGEKDWSEFTYQYTSNWLVHIISNTIDTCINIKFLTPYYKNCYNDRYLCPNKVKPCLANKLSYSVSDNCTKFIPILDDTCRFANDIMCQNCKEINLCQNVARPDRQLRSDFVCKNHYSIEVSTGYKKYCSTCTEKRVCLNGHCNTNVYYYRNDDRPDNGVCTQCIAIGLVCLHCLTLYKYNSIIVKYSTFYIFKNIKPFICLNCISYGMEVTISGHHPLMIQQCRRQVQALIISWKFYVGAVNNYIKRLYNELNYKGSTDLLTLVCRVLDITADQPVSIFRANIKLLTSSTDLSIQNFMNDTRKTVPCLQHQCIINIVTLLPKDIMLKVLDLI
ncbi:MAG: hypothetical protein Barrevirus11_8 [Barrevirus sp.]|uniref:Uncharacterized protein n=1 Tax=Barrevirus sp. TaxID=2487763 RepID=A0A3G4ZQ95_9VIRU|nr:MAG: hypothetical protein Barrevirus11_8 [Barrevirus sp.]